jgi:hypothetical protein
MLLKRSYAKEIIDDLSITNKCKNQVKGKSPQDDVVGAHGRMLGL